MRAIRLGVIAVAAGGLATAAWAETLSMTGTFPAPSREAAMLRSIEVERLSGRDGAQVGSAIERALSRQNSNGIAYFDIYYGGRRAGGGADGTLSGSNLTMLKAVKNCIEYAEMNREEAFRMASLYPAQVMGLDKELGKLQKGYKAEFIRVSKSLDLTGVFTNREFTLV